jgi:4-oxalomesaconate tautomerase
MLTAIPCVLMRGGTSKGPYFLTSDLPAEAAARDQVLLAVMGSPDLRQIDGIGGGDSLTSKVAIVGPSVRAKIDVEYLFAQVSVDRNVVDTAPNCGNMLAGVGPFAIERGLVRASGTSTTVRIYNVNSGKVIEAVVQTPNGRVTYEGIARIDGVPGTSAPIVMNFIDAAGAKTGKLLPTGNAVDTFDSVPVSCVDFTSPLVLMPASALGRTGYESKHELDQDTELLARLERIRRQAAVRMGMGDVSDKVLPKIALLALPRHGGSITSRYFVPWNCHAAHAITGALCVAAACVIPDSVASRLVTFDAEDVNRIVVEHPSGRLTTRIDVQHDAEAQLPTIRRAGIVGTARPLLSGVVYVSGAVWPQAA